ncbi:MAG: molecular chaperone DnaK, partial [Hymenobacter sp.]
EASSGLSDADIERMRQEAAANADADKAETERIAKVNQADSLIFQTEKQLKEFGDKLSGGNKTAVETALADLKKAYESKDINAIDAGVAGLNKAWEAASQEMYAAAGAQGGQPGGPDFGGADGGQGGAQGQPADHVTDVDYEEVDGK